VDGATPMLGLVYWLSGLMFSAAMILTVYRLAKGPTLPDRVVALDLMSTIAVGIAAGYAVYTRQPVYLDVAIVVALVSFLATVGFARYVELGTPFGTTKRRRLLGGEDRDD
jgi:multicomponent Na+:H+ antiporter subunit F